MDEGCCSAPSSRDRNCGRHRPHEVKCHCHGALTWHLRIAATAAAATAVAFAVVVDMLIVWSLCGRARPNITCLYMYRYETNTIIHASLVSMCCSCNATMVLLGVLGASSACCCPCTTRRAPSYGAASRCPFSPPPLGTARPRCCRGWRVTAPAAARRASWTVTQRRRRWLSGAASKRTRCARVYCVLVAALTPCHNLFFITARALCL